MDTFITRYCLSLLILTSITTTSGNNDTNHDESREPRVSGRIVKLYSGVKPEPYLCTGEGFQADRLNCAVFYRCVKEKSGKFTVFRYQCAPGTVYDPDVETCNHPRSTRRPECGSMLKPTAKPSYATIINEINDVQSEVPRPISTKEPIYTERTTFNPPTLFWSISTERINLSTLKPWASTAFTSPSSLDPTQKTPAFASYLTRHPWATSHQLTESDYTTAPSPPKTTQQSNLKNLDPCTSDGFMGDSENCRKFYRCVGNQRGGYVKYEFSCSEPTVWDDEIQGCNHPWAVKRSKCGRSMSYNDKSQTTANDSTEKSITNKTFMNNGGYGYKFNKTIQNQLQISHGSQVQQTQTQISNSNDVIQNQTQISYGEKISSNAGSLQNQTQISYGNAVSQSQTQIDYGYKGVQTQLQIDHSKNASQSQVQIQESTTAHTSTSSQNHNFDNNKCSENGFMGDSNDCKKFYRCVDNGKGAYMKYEYFCGDGTVWDPTKETCNHAWAVKHCGGKLPLEINEGYHTTIKSTEHSTTESTKSTPIYQSISNVPDIDDEDDVGYGNQNQETSSSTTTAKPTTTITTKSTTVQSTSTTTVNLNGSLTECKSSGFIGDDNDCKIFYRCVDNGRGSYTKYEFKCGDGTLWDPNIEACNHAWAVKSCGGSTSSNADVEMTSRKEFLTTQHSQTTVMFIQTTTQKPAQEDDYDTGYGSQNKEPSITTVRSTKQPESEDIDKSNQCRSSGFMEDHNDCKKFYRCVDDSNGGYTRYEFTCGEGTVWDSKIEACNHAWAVEKCGGGNAIENIETTSQSTHTTSHIKTTSGIHTTETSEMTNIPTHMTTSTTTKTPTSSDSNHKCSHSGFMGDISDCKKFYRCVDNGNGSYTRYEFTCGEGTVWDHKIEACNHAWAVEKCGGNSEPISTSATQKTTSQHPVIQDEDHLDTGYGNPNDEMTEYPHHGTTTNTADKTPNTSSSEGGICKNSGFMGDKDDCKKFYRCVDNGKGSYDRYEFSCGEGTAWDSSIEACNHVWAVKECGGSGSSSIQYPNSEATTQSIISSVAPENGQTQQSTEKTSSTQNPNENEIISDECTREGFYGNKKDCKHFYRCVDNGKGGFTKYEFSCGEGTIWNPDIQGCDHVNPNRPCGSTPSQEPANLNDDIDTQTTTTKSSTTTKEEEYFGSTQTINRPQSLNGHCESEGFYGNPTNCKKFCRCVANGNGGFIKYDFDCGEGTVWNQEIQACDHESSDNTCSGGYPNHEPSNQSESTTNIDSTTKKQEGTESYYSTSKQQESTDYTGTCSSEGFFAHPSDCKKFVRCVNNGKDGYTRYEFSCGDGTVWVQEIQACDHDNDVSGCSAHSQSTTTSHNTEGSSFFTSSTLESSSTESMIPGKEDDEFETETSKEPTNDKCNSEGYFANKEDCRKFYRCVDNGNGGYTKYDFDCGEGTAWDQDLQTCNHIYEVESCSSKSEEGNNNQQTTTNKNNGVTDNTSTSTKSTPTFSESSTSSSSNSQDKCKNEGYYGDSKDCKKFYRCVDNGKGGYTKHDFICADGTIWDQDITNCNHPEDVSNKSCNSSQLSSTGQESITSTITDSSNSTTSSTTESGSSSQNSTDCSQEATKKPSSTKVNCDHAGYYANPDDCKKFYRCVDWDGDGKRFSVFHFECGEGTIWDPALDTCNHEDSVYPQRDCSQTQSQNVTEETTTEGTTTEESSTSEQTTTQQSTTEESTTTQKSTTSEKTTTQDSTTSEKTTTQESTTSEQTTTQQPTTSEKTTTQESSTSEQTTIEQSTTSEKTTTQESTTSEQTTTQESTTAEQTTTEQTTTSEKTTTQESTTSEQTTTQQSTTSEQTTTQESATDSQTTTQESTTSEQTTSPESTTSEQTTAHLSTTSEQTTQESSTSEQTTEESTTSEQTTTQESTTDEQTTQQSYTTEQLSESTDDTATEQTTDSTSTDESTTESSTEYTSAPTTEESSSSSKDCPETEDDQYLLVCPTSFRRHPKYCNMFYQCTEDDDTSEAKVAMFKCPNNTIYDESQTQCVSEDKADKKCEGEIANKRRFKRLGLNYKDPIVADKGKLSCLTTGYFSFEKDSECSKAFLKCEKSVYGLIKGHVYQCPDGYIYWAISKRCERVDSIRDCKKTSNDWTGRWNIPVERKNLAIR